MKFPGDEGRVRRLSLINEEGEKFVRMAHLAALGSHAINGVAALHTELLKTHVLSDFYALTPEKFSNKTNGVTPRRWMVLSNPRLAQLLTRAAGPGLDAATWKSCAGWSRWSTTRSSARSGAPSSGRTSCNLPPTFMTGWELRPIRIRSSTCW